MLQVELIPGDRRAENRYVQELELRFSYRQDGQSHIGVGHTVDLSRNGIRFWTDSPPPHGAKVELRIRWPFLLQGTVPLELVVHGTVLRSDATGTALHIHDFAFHTCGEGSFDPPGPPERTCNFTA